MKALLRNILSCLLFLQMLCLPAGCITEDVPDDDARGNFEVLSRAGAFANYDATCGQAPSEDDYIMDDATRAKVEEYSVAGYDPTCYDNDADAMPTMGAQNGLTLYNLYGKGYVCQEYCRQYLTENIDFAWGDGAWHPFMNMQGLYVYNGVFSGFLMRMACGENIIVAHENERTAPVFVVKGRRK